MGKENQMWFEREVAAGRAVAFEYEVTAQGKKRLTSASRNAFRECLNLQGIVQEVSHAAAVLEQQRRQGELEQAS